MDTPEYVPGQKELFSKPKKDYTVELYPDIYAAVMSSAEKYNTTPDFIVNLIVHYGIIIFDGVIDKRS